MASAADALADRIAALAEALAAAGIDPTRAANLLGSAATATMHALMLDAVLEENAAPAVKRRQHQQPESAPAPHAQPLRVAA